LNAKAVLLGFQHAVGQYGIWKDGKQTIGCMNLDIKDVIARFEKEELDHIISLKRNP